MLPRTHDRANVEGLTWNFVLRGCSAKIIHSSSWKVRQFALTRLWQIQWVWHSERALWAPCSCWGAIFLCQLESLEAIYPPFKLGPQLRFSWRLEQKEASEVRLLGYRGFCAAVNFDRCVQIRQCPTRRGPLAGGRDQQSESE